ncbi:MAG TPA: hypothetical protein VGI19_16040 [Candidatus Cybelea sp.]|jgi:hypothetical protein
MTIDRNDIAQAIPRDARLEPANIALALAVAEELEEVLQRASSAPFDIINDTWKMFLLYYGARLLAVHRAGITLRFHALGREAEYTDRALFEFITKLLYYSTLRARASEALKTFPKQHLKLFRKLALDPSTFLTKEQMDVAENAADYNADATFKGLHDELMADSRFQQQRSRPAIKWYINNARMRWNQYWVIPSQVVHGAIPDVFAACKLDLGDPDHPKVSGELDSFRPRANGSLLDSCQYAVFAWRHLQEEFGLEESSTAPPLVNSLNAALLGVDEVDGPFDAQFESGLERNVRLDNATL